MSEAGFAFRVDAADVDEAVLADEAPETYVARVALAKARAVAARHAPEAVILAADTTVAIDGEILGKPMDGGDAARMLSRLSGTAHDVWTAVVVKRGDAERTEVVRTRVHFLPLSSSDLTWYVGTGEPDGKAGAYAIQGLGARFVDRIEGSWSNVVGLPVATVHQMLKKVGA